MRLNAVAFIHIYPRLRVFECMAEFEWVFIVDQSFCKILLRVKSTIYFVTRYVTFFTNMSSLSFEIPVSG